LPSQDAAQMLAGIQAGNEELEARRIAEELGLNKNGGEAA
jgi:hypothetical protein